jgi:hypothetical protein
MHRIATSIPDWPTVIPRPPPAALDWSSRSRTARRSCLHSTTFPRASTPCI